MCLGSNHGTASDSWHSSHSPTLPQVSNIHVCGCANVRWSSSDTHENKGHHGHSDCSAAMQHLMEQGEMHGVSSQCLKPLQY